MLIILEGPDGAGKTTLAEIIRAEISRQYPNGDRCEVLHKGPPTADPISEYEGPLFAYRPLKGMHIVCDRWHIGEVVYAPVLQRDSHMDVAMLRHIDLLLRSRGALIVVLNPPIETLIERTQQRGESFITEDQLRAVHLRYNSTQLPRYLYDVSYMIEPPDIYELAKGIVRSARQLELDAIQLHRFETYIGPPKPDVLLLGENRGVGGRLTHSGRPAFVPAPGTSGHYLLSHLSTWGTEQRPETYGLANACDVDDPLALWKTLDQPRVVALGKFASSCLTDLGIQHGAVPHPQFIRRFHHHSGPRYAEVIRLAASEQDDLSGWRP